ncbi:conserved hypothetical protein, partial [Ricinus communis]
MRQVAVRQAQHDVAGGLVAVVVADQDRRVHDAERIGLLPLPRAFAIRDRAAVPVGVEVDVAGRVLVDDPRQGLHRREQPLDGQRVAVVKIHRLAVGIDALLVGVQLIGGDGRQAVREHAVAVDRVGQQVQRTLHLVGIDAHQGQARPLLQQVGVVRQAAAEVAVGNLALVDPPVDELGHPLEVFRLAEGPQRHAVGRLGLLEGRPALAAIGDVAPVFAAFLVVGIHPQQVGNVGVEAAIEALALGGGVLLHQEGPVVLHLVEAVGYVLGLRFLAGLEHQADLGAVQGLGTELGAVGGDGQYRL